MNIRNVSIERTISTIAVNRFILKLFMWALLQISTFFQAVTEGSPLICML